MQFIARLQRSVARAIAALSIGVLVVTAAGCDDMPDGVPLVNGADFGPGLSVSPAPIALTPLAGVRCTAGRVAFDTSLHLLVNAGIRDVTVESVTIQMIDGTNLGGPALTFPRAELTTRFGSTVINAGTTRDFALHPDFGCLVRAPTALRSSALVVDNRGRMRSIGVDSTLR